MAGDVQATLSPAMDILVSSNSERLLWYLAFEPSSNPAPDGDTRVEVLELARRDFLAERVSDDHVCAL